VAVLQVVGAALVAGAALLLTGERAAVAAFTGGAVSALAWMASGVRALSGSPAGSGVVLMRLVGALFLKWLIVCGGLWIAMVQWRLPPLALIGGFGAALVAGSLALGFGFRGSGT
jgi:ATP synthase protein I